MNKQPNRGLKVIDPGSLTVSQKRDIFTQNVGRLMATAAKLELPVEVYNDELMRSVIAQEMMTILRREGKFEAFQMAMQSEDPGAIQAVLTNEIVEETSKNVLSVLSCGFERFFDDMGLGFELKMVHTLEDYLKESTAQGRG